MNGRKTIEVNVIFSNPKAVIDAVTEAVCTLDIIDVDDPPSWNERSYRSGGRFSVIEECASEIGKCIDGGRVFAVDEDNQARDIEYSANDRFFTVATDRNRLKLCKILFFFLLKKLIKSTLTVLIL